MISLGHVESGHGALPGFVFWRATANSASVKSAETLIGVAVGVLQRSATSFDTSRVAHIQHPRLVFEHMKFLYSSKFCHLMTLLRSK